ncbi:DNA starvation/stationary phase protection protein [bacterium]|nr:DNA starvation/stationary phase protection protein [bacterium]
MKSPEILQVLLHETLILSLKTQSFHWNVEGPNFGPLHDLFGTQYESLQEAADTIAERIRALGEYPHPHNSNEGAEALDPIPSKPPKFTKMLEILAVDNQKVGIFCGRTSEMLAAEDPATSNLLAERQMQHEKAAWMLRSHLK